jgi:hypothetical protein
MPAKRKGPTPQFGKGKTAKTSALKVPIESARSKPIPSSKTSVHSETKRSTNCKVVLQTLDDSDELSPPASPSQIPSPPPSPGPSSPSTPTSRAKQELDHTKLFEEVQWLKAQYMQHSNAKSPEVPVPEGNSRTYALLFLLTFHPFSAATLSFTCIPEKLRRQQAIRCVRDELSKGNIHLSAGGIRANLDQLVLCNIAFSKKLCSDHYGGFSDLVEPLVKHALTSVLKTEGRKSEEKKEAYGRMLENGKARVQRWRLSQRMRVVWASHFSELSPEEFAKKQEVCFVRYFRVYIIHLRALFD